MTTDLECFRATVEHRRPPRVLYYAGFTPDLKRRIREHIGCDDIAAHYGLWQRRHPDVGRRAGAQPPDYSPYWADVQLPEGTYINGVGVAMAPGSMYHFRRYLSPLENARSLSDIESYPLEDPSDWLTDHLSAEVEAAHAEGLVAEGWVGHMYETAWQIRGYEQFLMDMVERPSWAECLLERLAARNAVRAEAFARAGADLIRCGDDVANQRSLMFSPDMWRRMIHSRWSRIWRRVKEIHPCAVVWYHSDGNVAPIVGELVEDGLDILNPLQPECLDVDGIHRRYGHRLSFDGLMGTQSTMPHGSPDDVRRRVRDVLDRYGCDGGVIISPTHVLEPEVPLANIDALFAACRDYGSAGDV
ncbi:MAG: uroporphyrinogen decarboxylase family protein [Planctomycetota bacterium]